MSRIRTQGQAARLRARVMEKRRIEQLMREVQLRSAKKQVEYLQDQLSSERRLKLQQGLAYWESAVDSLEDDGVMPVPKEFEPA